MTSDVCPPGLVEAVSGEDLAPLADMPAWLRALDDPLRVREALLRGGAARTAAAVGAGALTGVRLRRVRLRSGRWTAVCRLVPDGGGDPVQVGATVTAPGSGDLPELRLAPEPLPEPDPALPALARLLDPDGARDLLTEAIGGNTARRRAALGPVEPTVLRHGLGERCAVLLRLRTAGRRDGWPDAVVAKTYRRPEQGLGAWAGMRALWSSRLSAHPAVRIAEPLAWLDGARVLLQEALPHERTLRKQLALDLGAPPGAADVPGGLEDVGAAVAALHGCGVSVGAVRTWHDELGSVRAQLDELTAALPALAGVADPLLGALDRAAAEEPPDPALASHGSLRPGQVLVGGDRVALVDFDGFGLAEPAEDLGRFRATVRDVAFAALPSGRPLPERLAATDRLADAFLRGYRSPGRVTPGRVRLWEVLGLFTVVLHSWTKAQPERLGRDLALLRHVLRPAAALPVR